MPVYKKHNGKPVVGYSGAELGYTDPIVTSLMHWYYQNSDGSSGKPLSLKQENEMLGRMDYQEAKKIREKSFGTLLAEQKGGFGSSLKSAISKKTTAKITGIKEAFHPLNIAKKLTGGSNLAPAILGKMFGVDKKKVDYFSGVKPKHTASLESGGSSLDSPEALESLGYIYKSLKQSIDDKHQAETQAKEAKQKEEDDENTRNEELVKALTGRRKKKEKPYRDEKGRFAKRPTEETKPTVKTETPSVFKPSAARTATPTGNIGGLGVSPSTVSTGLGMTAKIGTAAVVAGGGAIITGGLMMPSDSVAQVIDKASNLVGVDKSLMYAMAKQESGFNPSAAAKTSSAKGLYQFIKGTWKGMVEKYGSKFPILRERGPEDAEANAIAGALFIKDNSDYLAKFKIPVNATTIYAAHFLGPDGARKLLTANPDQNATTILPEASQANKPIFYDKSNNPRTVQQVIDVLFQKVGQYQEKYTQALNKPNDTGNKVYQASNDLKNNKADLVASNEKSSQNVNTTNVNAQKEKSSQTIMVGSNNDKPAYLNKAAA